MLTRKDYLSGKVSHEEYYAQFVTPQVFDLISRFFGYEKLCAAYAKDPNFNNIALQIWDNLTSLFQCNDAMKKAGDYATLAGKVCVLKEAARQIAG